MTFLSWGILAGIFLIFPAKVEGQWSWQEWIRDHAEEPGFLSPGSGSEGYLLPGPDSFPFLETGEAPFFFSLPDPEGNWTRFQFRPSPVMAPALAERYREIRTFQGHDPEDPRRQVRMEYTPRGLTAEVRGGGQRYSLAPLEPGSTQYSVIDHGKFSADRPSQRQCLRDPASPLSFAEDARALPFPSEPEPRSHGLIRRRYRLALAANAQYAQAVSGGTPSLPMVLSAMVITVNRINGIFERELAVRLELIPQTEDLIYLMEPDPYGNHNPYQVQTQNQANIDSVVGTAHYDIGHVFTTGGGGLAEIASICNPATKAMGVTGQPHPVGDRFDVDYVAHEMGHQLGATHSFNTHYSGSCLGNAYWLAAYEPGSGSSIMSYAGLCGSQNDYALHCDDYFHRVNLLQIRDFLADPWGGARCGSTDTGMTPPMLPVLGQQYFIPAHTPFELAVDAPVPGWYYSWEQWNLGQFGIDFSLARTGPLFRSFPPQMDGRRVFPRMESLVSGPPYPGEKLPDTAQELVFVLTVRSQDQGWGSFTSSEDSVRIQVLPSPRPFAVIDPGPGRDHWQAGTTVSVTWDPVGTAAPPVSCSEVDLLLSLDGGQHFPILLDSAVPNTGQAWVTLPIGLHTSKARLKIKARQQPFFALSPRDFRIDPWPEALDALSSPKGWTVFPNPGGDYLEIQTEDRGERGTWVLYDLQGRRLAEGKYPEQRRIPAAHWASGLYLLEWTSHYKGQKSWIKWQKR